MKEEKDIVTGSDLVNVLKESDSSLDSLLYLLSLVKTDGELKSLNTFIHHLLIYPIIDLLLSYQALQFYSFYSV